MVDLNNLKICLICSQIQKRKLNLPVSAPINVQSSEDSIIILVPDILSYHAPCARRLERNIFDNHMLMLPSKNNFFYYLDFFKLCEF